MKTSLGSRSRGLNIIKMSVFCKLNHKFDVIPMKITMSFLMDLDKLMLKFIWKNKTCKNSKENTEEDEL